MKLSQGEAAFPAIRQSQNLLGAMKVFFLSARIKHQSCHEVFSGLAEASLYPRPRPQQRESRDALIGGEVAPRLMGFK